MGWILVLIFIIILIISILDALDFILLGVVDFFVHSTWGILTLIFGLLSLIFFYASGRSYKDVKVNESFLPNLDNLNNSNRKRGFLSMFKKKQEIVEYDLSQLTLNALTKKMAFEITKPGPVFFKGWGNRRLLLDVERVEILRDYVEAIRDAGSSLLKLHADSVISFEKMQALVQIERSELRRQLKEAELKIDLMETEYQTTIDKLKIDVSNLEMTVYERIANVENRNAETELLLSEIKNKSKELDTELELKRKQSESDIRIREEESMARIEIEKQKAGVEVFVMKLKAKDDSNISKKRAEALDMIVKEMELDNISPTEVYLLVKLLDTNSTSDYMDFDNKLKIMGEELEQMKIQNDIRRAEAKERKAKADEVEAQAKQNIKDLYKNK